jgi:hypothetical protein
MPRREARPRKRDTLRDAIADHAHEYFLAVVPEVAPKKQKPLFRFLAHAL